MQSRMKGEREKKAEAKSRRSRETRDEKIKAK